MLDLLDFVDFIHQLFGRDGRRAWPGCLLIVGGTVLGIWLIYHFSSPGR